MRTKINKTFSNWGLRKKPKQFSVGDKVKINSNRRFPELKGRFAKIVGIQNIWRGYVTYKLQMNDRELFLDNTELQ